ncbi:MAG: carboxypeptidase regulatory-like domain-containing protein [Gemmatimonadaceae bacterium]
MLAFAVPLPRNAIAQGVSTGAIRGTVRTAVGTAVDGARVQVRNTSTGFSTTARVVRGRFFVQGLDVGGPYVVEVRQLGFAVQRSAPLVVTLGEPLELRIELRPAAIELEGVSVIGAEMALSAGGGTATVIPDSLLHRLPAVNRNFIDFVPLAPQVSTKIGFQRSGLSAAGANLRFNAYLIDGADERFVNGNVSAANNLGKSIPLDAVKEYQVLLAPYDVRYGDFAGALVNTVTRSGTNELHGSAFAYWRNDRLARGGDLAPSEPYERWQYGFSLGGPIVRDRVHFFVAPELQRLTSPSPGAYLGQPPGQPTPVPVSTADVERFQAILRARGLTPGSGGLVEVRSPLRNLFARIDVALPSWHSRIMAYMNSARSDNTTFSRTSDVFALSSSSYVTAVALRLTSVQLHSEVPWVAGGHNELLLSHSTDESDQVLDAQEPVVRVRVPGIGGGAVSLLAGTPEAAQGRFRRSRSIRVKEELTLPWSARNVLVLGVLGDRFLVRNGGVIGGYGSWTFASLDDFERGTAERYDLRKDLGGASAPLRGGQYSAYIGNDWRAHDALSITAGVRADMLQIDGRAPYDATVDGIFGRRTDAMPRRRVHLSPRAGFIWDFPGRAGHRLRGGMGVFTGRPPLAWIQPALATYGGGSGVLRCGPRPTDAGAPPAFRTDYRDPPTACATGPDLTSAPFGDVDLLDVNLRMAQSLRASLAYERRLPLGLRSTSEVLVTQYRSDFMFVNLNLVGPQSVDRFERVLYGTVAASGVSEPALRSTQFSEVIDLRNTSRNRAYQLSTRLERRYEQRVAATLSYTYSRMRDVQSPSRVNIAGQAIWADARDVSGRHDDMTLGISLNDLPHRVVGTVTYTAPWRRWTTDVTLFYVGESGGPFTFRARGVGGRGDLNVDGSNANDPIYVPRSGLDTAEIRFSGRSDSVGADNSVNAQATRVRVQQDAFEGLIERTSCLRRQRGRILERNGCREPWSHTTIASVRQLLPLGGRALEAELHVFNVLNLLNGAWGRYRVANPQLLEHVGQITGPAELAQPVFRFDTTRPAWTTLRTESAFQLQVAMRYRF